MIMNKRSCRKLTNPLQSTTRFQSVAQALPSTTRTHSGAVRLTLELGAQRLTLLLNQSHRSDVTRIALIRVRDRRAKCRVISSYCPTEHRSWFDLDTGAYVEATGSKLVCHELRS